jgi:hypothetical protein
VLISASQLVVAERGLYWNGGGQFWGALNLSNPEPDEPVEPLNLLNL